MFFDYNFVRKLSYGFIFFSYNGSRCILTMSSPATERLVMKAKKTNTDLIG